MSVNVNPYAPPKAHVSDVVPASSEAESIRRQYIKHEASVRSVGTLYYVSAAFMVLAAVVLVAAGLTGTVSWIIAVVGAVYLVLGGLSFAVAHGVRMLRPWARTTCIVLSSIGLLGFPVGTVVNGYFLYLFLCAKGKRIFEPDYAAIVAATPQVKYRTSSIVWIVLAVLLLVVAAAVVVPLLNT